jgi:hypothetical protein
LTAKARRLLPPGMAERARAADLDHEIVVPGERHRPGQVGPRLGGLGRLEGLQEAQVIAKWLVKNMASVTNRRVRPHVFNYALRRGKGGVLVVWRSACGLPWGGAVRLGLHRSHTRLHYFGSV